MKDPPHSGHKESHCPEFPDLDSVLDFFPQGALFRGGLGSRLGRQDSYPTLPQNMGAPLGGGESGKGNVAPIARFSRCWPQSRAILALLRADVELLICRESDVSLYLHYVK